MRRMLSWTATALAAFCLCVGNVEAQRQIARHQGITTWAEFSHDGKMIASVGDRDLIRIWDAETGDLLRIMSANSGYPKMSYRIRGLNFSPNGRYLASYGYLETAYWHVETGKREPLPREEYLSSNPAFTPDSRAFITCSVEGVLRLRDAETTEILMQMNSSRNGVFQTYLSPDGRLAACMGDGRIEVWNLETGEAAALIEAPNEPGFSSLVFLPDSRTIAAVSVRMDPDSTDTDEERIIVVHLLDALTGGVKRSYEAGYRQAYFSPDGLTLATYSEREMSARRKILLWDVETGTIQSQLEGMYSFQGFSPDGKRVGGRTDIESIGLWDVETGALKVERDIRIHKMRFSPDGTRIVGFAGSGQIHILDAETLQTHRQMEGHGAEVLSVQFSQDGRSVLSVGGDLGYTAHIWNASTGEERMWTSAAFGGTAALSPDSRTVAVSDNRRFEVLKVPTGEAIAEISASHMGQVAYSPDGKTLAYVVGNATETVYFWDAAESAGLEKTYEHDSHIRAIAYSPDGAAFAAAGGDSIRLWDAETDELKQSINGDGAQAHSIAFSPAGGALVSGGEDSVVRIWSARGAHLRARLSGHEGPVYSVAYSPDGRHIASAGEDGLIRLWDAKTFQLERTLSGHIGWVNSVDFSPDGRSLISGGKDGRVLLWRLEDMPILWSDAKRPNSWILQTTLLPTYPNPFNPETWIPFDLAQESAVTIAIYDSAGQTVRRLELGELPAGSYRVKGKAAYWDGRDALGAPAASGVYFVRIEAGVYTETRRMVLLK